MFGTSPNMKWGGIGLIVISACLLACSDAPPKTGKAKETSTAKAAFSAPDAWQEFEETLRLFYAYIERDDFDVEAQLARSKELAIAAKTDPEFRRILHQTAYAFTDPHFIVGPFEDDDYNIIPTSSDLKVGWQGERLVVVEVRQGSAAAKEIQTGWFILEIDGIEARAASRKPFGDVVKNPTPRQLNYGANLAVNGLRAGSRRLTVMTHQGQEKDIKLPTARDFAVKVSNMPMISTNPFGDSVIKQGELYNNFGFIRINNQLGNNELIAAFDRVLETMLGTDGLVLDLRNTPSGGNTEVARSIIGHFITETRPYQVHEIPSLEREFTVPRRFIEQVKPRAPYYDKPVVVLGGPWTGSMGEGIVIGMDAAANAYTITSDMGDLLGGLSNFNMEKSTARVDIGTEALFHVNGTPREDYVGDLMLSSADTHKGFGDSERPALRRAWDYLKSRRD